MRLRSRILELVDCEGELPDKVYYHGSINSRIAIEIVAAASYTIVYPPAYQLPSSTISVSILCVLLAPPVVGIVVNNRLNN